jgi:uncharacterized protein YbjT (DUF2867 family)
MRILVPDQKAENRFLIMPGSTALLFGSSGMTGKFLLQLLLEDPRFEIIRVFNRKPCGIHHPRLEEFVTGFEPGDTWENKVKGDALFCCLGTTIAKAGSQDAFRRVDYELPVRISKVGAKNGIATMLVMSSLGADAESGNFYLRTKGEMEEAISRSGIPQVHFFRPSMLLGPRTESRPAETMGKIAMQALSFLFIGKKYSAIHANTVAKAMIRIATEPGYSSVIESDQIAALGK